VKESVMKRVALLLFVGSVVWTFASLRAQSGFPDGEGKALTENLCTSCHGAEETLAKRETEAGWKLIVTDMVGFGMEATPEDQAIVAKYLGKYFGRTEKPSAPSTPDPAPAP
jgi:hypothetical protein